jgi:sulfur carrier protein
MNIKLNGEDHRIEGDTVAALLDALRLSSAGIAVAVNDEVVPRDAHATHTVHENDRVEIIRAIGGG